MEVSFGVWFRHHWGYLPLLILSPLLFALPVGLWPLFILTTCYFIWDAPHARIRRDMRRESRKGVQDEELTAWLNQ